MDLEELTSANPADAQKEWDAIAVERGHEVNAAADTPLTTTDMIEEDATHQTEGQGTTANAGTTGEEDQATTQAAAAAAAEADKTDPLKELTEKIAKLEGQVRNVNGHIGGLNHGQQQLREMMTAAGTAAAKVKEAPTQAQVAEAMTNPAEWDALREDFPEWATATEKLLDARLSGLQQKAPAIDPAAIDRIVEERVAKQAATVRLEVIDSHLDAIIDGDWNATVKTEQFGKWLDAQPDDVKALAESSRLTDAAKMLRLFDKSRSSNQTQQIIDQRKAKLDGATTVKSGMRTTKSKAPDDMTPQELWNYEAAQREKRNARG